MLHSSPGVERVGWRRGRPESLPHPIRGSRKPLGWEGRAEEPSPRFLRLEEEPAWCNQSRDAEAWGQAGAAELSPRRRGGPDGRQVQGADYKSRHAPRADPAPRGHLKAREPLPSGGSVAAAFALQLCSRC